MAVTSLDVLFRIWAKQSELNKMTFGRDTINCDDPAVRVKWSIDYLIALHDEATELYNCFRWKWWDSKVKKGLSDRFELFDLGNAKIEVVDMIFFYISLCQLWLRDRDYKHLRTISKLMLDTRINGADANPKQIFDCIIGIIVEIAMLIRYLSRIQRTGKYTTVNENIVIASLVKIAADLGIVINFLGMNRTEVLSVYLRKCEINEQREKSEYTMDCKDESDNRRLAGMLAKEVRA